MNQPPTSPYYANDKVTLHLGDSLDILPTLPDASVDAIVTDPPYGLSDMPPANVTRAIAAWMAGDRTHVPDGRGFMGKSWDRFVPPPGLWDECFRVLKPGGHLAAFAGSRTVDLMGLSIRMAGFEIRDSLHWITGTGFPKSLDVSKSIDKAAGAQREVVGSKVGLPGYSLAPSTGDHRTYGRGLGNTGDPQAECAITAPATEDARRWSGFGTALKPAHEPIILARRPLEGTVAGNVLAHGTGALNIDGCRVAAADSTRRTNRAEMGYHGGNLAAVYETGSDTGRWPSNVILTHPPLLDEHGQPVGDACVDGCVPGCPVAEMDAQSGHSASVRNVRKAAGGVVGNGHTHGRMVLSHENVGGHNDEGGASRFFPVFRYEAKAPARERPRLPDGTAHSTVKPLALMSWLVRLVTPPGGAVLEPFAGSGTTLAAALREGMTAIGVEQHEPYAQLCVQRLSEPYSVALFGDIA